MWSSIPKLCPNCNLSSLSLRLFPRSTAVLYCLCMPRVRRRHCAQNYSAPVEFLSSDRSWFLVSANTQKQRKMKSNDDYTTRTYTRSLNQSLTERIDARFPPAGAHASIARRGLHAGSRYLGAPGPATCETLFRVPQCGVYTLTSSMYANSER